MRREAERDNIVFEAIVKKLPRNVRIVAVHNQQARPWRWPSAEKKLVIVQRGIKGSSCQFCAVFGSKFRMR